MPSTICARCRQEPSCLNSSYCKACRNAYQKDYYKRNPQSVLSSSRRRTRKLRAIVTEAKNKPCADCGQRFPHYVMDLDHRRGKKEFQLGQGLRKSERRIMEEISKCDVVCANCHRERTFRDRLNGRTAAFEAENLGSNPSP
jgi:hypothetical protein